jgi:hypothetical protein
MKGLKRGIAVVLAAVCATASLSAVADDAQQELARDLGAVLAWRLGPLAVEQKCRELDPAGNEIRAQALKSWSDKNAQLISAVDARVLEVVPFIQSEAKPDEAARLVGQQVSDILLEAIFDGKTAEESKVICQTEANPLSARWNSNGRPHVQESLAALYDWVTQQKK